MITIPSRFNGPAHRSAKRIVARRGCALVAIAGLAGACGVSDTATNDTSPTMPATAPTPSSVVVAPTVAPTTPAPASTAAAPTPTPASDTTPSPPPSTSPSTTPASPTLSIPEPVRGTWRESEAASVSFDECREEAGYEQNFDKVLTIGADRFSYFETGGKLIEVHEQDESRIDATYDTTYADTPTQERLTFDAKEDGNVLIVRDETRPGPIRYLRCPAAPTDQAADTAPLELDAFTSDTVRDAGLEGIGCWLRPGQASDVDPVFFVSGAGGMMVIEDKTVTVPDSTTDEDAVIPPVAVGLTYSGDGYAATFAAVGSESATSIESSDRDVTLAVSTPDGRSTYIDGVLGCGV